jgi:hypothetical protein
MSISQTAFDLPTEAQVLPTELCFVRNAIYTICSHIKEWERYQRDVVSHAGLESDAEYSHR